MKIDKKTTGEFIDLYNSGLSSEKIAKKYGTTRQTVLRHLKSNGVEVGIYQTNNNKIVDIFSESLKKNILKRYSEQETINDISETLNIKRNQVLLILKDLHIKIRDRAWESKKYKTKRDFFNKIDSDEKAYFLGLIFSDGCLSKNRLILTLQEKDKYILEKLAKLIFLNDYKIYTTELSKKNKNHQNSCSLVISDKILVDKLKEKYELCENKTFKLKFPNFLNKTNLLYSFIRGYFDGDGCITLENKNRKAIVSIVCNEIFASGLEKFLIKNGIKAYNYKKGKNNREIKFRENASVEKFYKLMYLNTEMYLYRKKDKFEIFKKTINEKTSNSSKS